MRSELKLIKYDLNVKTKKKLENATKENPFLERGFESNLKTLCNRF